MRYQQVKYKLINNDTGEILGNNDKGKFVGISTDPQNWDESEKTLKRSNKTFGVYTELSKNLVFTKDAADFLKRAYLYKDIEADVTLQEYRLHPKTEQEYLHSAGVFDFSEYKADKLTVKVPFKSGGLNSLIQSQLREKFELERLESINGKTINPINKKKVALTSRKIFLVSDFDTDDAVEKITMSVESNAGNTRNQTTGMPLKLIGKSHEQAQFVINGSTGDENNGSTGMMFFLIADRERTLNLTFNFDLDVQFTQYEQVQWGQYNVNLTTYQNGNFYDVKNRDLLADISSSLPSNVRYPYGIFTKHINIPETKKTVTLQAGESLAIELFLKADMYVSNTAGVRADAKNFIGSLLIEEYSFFKDTQSEAVLMHEAGDKLMQILTGEKRFYSEFYGRKELGYNSDGEFSRTGLSLGFWIRQFYEKNMELSLDDYLKTSNAIHNTGYTIEVIDGKETLVVEDLKYFFQDAVAIVLPNQVSKVEREAYSEFCDSSLEFGYKKGGDYEEAMGLDEYNIKTGFTTPLKRVDTKYSKLSSARADAYAKEFARRKQKESYPTTDTQYDKDIHLLDLKEGLGRALEERLWQDDFEVAPTGVYSPETATNLRLTPAHLEQRHEWFYGAGLLKQQDEKIRYSNTGGNNSLVTKKTGQSARGEKDDINISDLERPRFQAIWATFKHPLDHNIYEQLNGKTNVKGRLIPNVYFKVQFIDNQQKKRTGYLFEQRFKGNNLGEFKLLLCI